MRISDWSSDVCSSDLIDGGSRLDKVVGHESPSLFSASRVCARRRHRAARAMGAGRAMNRRGPGKLRVIGGEWRSRVIEFDAANGVRPTPDRIRQTLFDWLAPRIDGARCLDLRSEEHKSELQSLMRISYAV